MGVPLGGGDVGAGVVADFPGDGVGAVPKGRGDTARHRQRPLQAAPVKAAARRQNFAVQTARSKAAQQFAPELLGVRVAQQRQRFFLPGGHVVFLPHLLRRFVFQ